MCFCHPQHIHIHSCQPTLIPTLIPCATHVCLTRTHPHPQLGVRGVLVLDAREGGPASKAGIKGTSRDSYGRLVLGDIIVAFNGAPVKYVFVWEDVSGWEGGLGALF